MVEESQPSRVPVTVTVDAGVAAVVLDRPERDNRVDVVGLEALHDAFVRCAEEDVEVVVLRGRGDDFCAGRDAQAGLQGRSRRELVELVLAVNDRLDRIPAITLAQVHGRALGFGCGLAVACDLTIAAQRAVLGFPEVRHGIAPAIVISYLDRYVPRKAAADLVLTGRELPADEARDLGLVSRVVADHDLDRAVADTIAELRGSPVAARRDAKRLLRSMAAASPAERAEQAVAALAPPD